MAKYSGLDAFIFKPFPGIPWPEWEQVVLPEIEIVPHFPGIPNPYFDKLEVASIDEVKDMNELDEIASMADFGLFG